MKMDFFMIIIANSIKISNDKNEIEKEMSYEC